MKKRIIKIFPFLFIPVLMPIYYILDVNIFVNIFGCGCSPHLNANDLRKIVFSILVVIVVVVYINLSKGIDPKNKRISHCFIVFIVNFLYAFYYCSAYYFK